ncbi:MAG: cyanate hydratase [Clostridia bacterium]|nr:cyanate hydratase [Clostridia bacterium]
MELEKALEIVRKKKEEKGLSIEELAAKVGHDPVYMGCVLHGQHPLTEESAAKLAEILELDQETVAPLKKPPIRNWDPLKYRLHEMVEVYADSIRDLVNEHFGDGILSAIDLEVRFEKKGNRAVITIDSKFLPYKVF